MPLGKTLIVSLIATALLGSVAAAVALGPAVSHAVVVPASAPEPTGDKKGEMMFMMGARATVVLGFAVEETSDVRIRLVLTQGETTDLFMDGPGDCDNMLRGANVGDGRSVSIPCPDLAPGEYRVELTHKAGHVWGRLSATPVDDGGSGEDASADAVPATQTFEGDATTTASVTAPYPTCPLACSVSYAWGVEGFPDFEVREGATRIVVTATWEARHPADAFRISLSRLVEEQEGGGRIYEGVADAEGVGTVTFEAAGPELGVYDVGAWQPAPAGADALRTLHYVVEVHYG